MQQLAKDHSISSILDSLIKPRLRSIVILLSTAASMFLLVAVLVYGYVGIQGCPIYKNINDIPQMPVAIVFGAGIGTPVLQDRVHTAIMLYRHNKIHKILMTGDNGHSDYDEPQAMKAIAVAQGVPSKDVVCDYAGFRTYDSLYRAREIFDVQNAILVTQKFHLPRAIFIAKHLGLSVVGMDASLHSYGVEENWFTLRELAATENAWLDVISHRKPKFLGKKEPLFSAKPS